MNTIRTFAGLLVVAAALFAQDPIAAKPASHRVPKVYDCSALIADMANGSAVPGVDAKGAKVPEDVLQAARSRHSLIGLASAVRYLMRPALLETEDVVAMGDRWLVVLGEPEQHAWMDRMVLADLKDGIPIARMQVRAVKLPNEVFETAVKPALRGEGQERAVVVLEPGDATEAFVAATTRHEEGVAMDLGEVEVRRMQPASIASTSQTAYIRDFEVERQESGAVIANPLIDVVQDGLSLQAVADAGASGVASVSITASWADLERPIPKFTTSLGVGKPVTIELPNVRIGKVEATVELQDGQIVAMALPESSGARVLVFVRFVPAVEKPSKR